METMKPEELHQFVCFVIVLLNRVDKSLKFTFLLAKLEVLCPQH